MRQAEEESLEAERSSLAQERPVFTGLGAHPCLVTCYGHATGRPQPKPQLVALVQEWLPGGNLHSMLLCAPSRRCRPLMCVQKCASLCAIVLQTSGAACQLSHCCLYPQSMHAQIQPQHGLVPDPDVGHCLSLCDIASC